MILPDINLLVFAYNTLAPRHLQAKAWWEELLNEGGVVGVPWVVVLGFVRLVTHPRVLDTPLHAEAAMAHVSTWFAQPSVRVLEPGPRHLSILSELFRVTKVAANLTTDTHLAALAIEHQCELHSNDADFARFPGLRWKDPLRSR